MVDFPLRIMTVVKTLITFALFGGFFYLSSSALIELFSGKTTFVQSVERSQRITSLPSFSVCPNWHQENAALNKTQLAKGMMGNISNATANFPFSLKVELTEFTSDGFIPTDLIQGSKMKDYIDFKSLEDLWSLQCKPTFGRRSGCIPCVTFNGAQMKNLTSNPELVGLLIMLTEDINYRGEEGIIQLNEVNQSFLLRKEYDWKHAIIYTYTPFKT